VFSSHARTVIRSGDILVKPPHESSGAQPNLAHLSHGIEESITISWSHSRVVYLTLRFDSLIITVLAIIKL